MFKRATATLVGLFAILAGLIALLNFVEFFFDTLRDPHNNPPIIGIPIDFVILCMGCGAVALGVKFALYGWNDPGGWRTSWIRPILLGLGLFFPGLVFSIPLAFFIASRSPSGEDTEGFSIALWIGLATAVIGCATLLTRHHLSKRSRTPDA